MAKNSEDRISNNQVNAVGEALARMQPIFGKDLGAQVTRLIEGVVAIAVVDAWRSSHMYPLGRVAANLRRRANAVDPSSTVSRRLKRLESIIAKLQRYPRMALTSMQDIGGCRAILESIKQVNELKDYYKASTERLEALKEKNYIEAPKADGYRSVHVVVRPNTQSNFGLAGRRIEIQLRTRLQHQWATAVETVDFFTRQTLKIGGGNDKWKRFFALTGSIFAAKESCPLVPQTPNKLSELVEETYDLWHDLGAYRLLTSWAAAMNYMMDRALSQCAPERDMLYLVELDVDRRSTAVTPFPPERVAEAQAAYAEKEKLNLEESNRSAVLVSVESIEELRAAYPSYYGDASDFLKQVGFVLSLNGKPLI